MSDATPTIPSRKPYTSAKPSISRPTRLSANDSAIPAASLYRT